MKGKQFVSLDETLSYLQFLNTDKQAFTQKQFTPTNIMVQPKGLQLKLKRVESLMNKKNIDATMGEQGGKKNINKNRAIKRIIDTSKQILKQNYKYQQPFDQNQKKSYITQFNIYLKQYNRLSQQILAQKNQKQQKKRQQIEHEQQKLEDVYSFTVEQEFKDIIQVSILKDKINKSNVQMLMQTFKRSLVVLRTNELKIYQNESQSSTHRDIKLHEIENVDYFSQPYIFTLMTVVKDKSSTSQFLCLKFQNIQRQHKWDRAVYCCYVSRKMKHKGKYFLLQYPQKQQQKQSNQGMEHIIKKRDDIKHYDVDRRKIIKNLQTQKQKQKQNKQSRLGTIGIESERDLPTIQRRGQKMQRFNTENQIGLNSPNKSSKQVNILMSTKNSDHKQFFQPNFKGKKSSKVDSSQNPLQQDPPNQRSISKQGSVTRPGANNGTSTNLNNNQKQNDQKPNDNDNIRQSQRSPQSRLDRQGTPNGANLSLFIKPVLTQSDEYVQKQIEKEKKILNPYTKRKIELKQKHEVGIRVTKIKFFTDKFKLFYLGNQQLQYWDYDPLTMHKSEKKLINFKDLKSYKIVRQKNSVSIVFELSSKTLMFSGKIEDLNDMVEWIQLPAKERQFQRTSYEQKKQQQKKPQANNII